MTAISDRLNGVLTYSLAAVIGVLAVTDLMPLATILGNGGMWTSPPQDIAQALTAHLAFQADGWHLPLFLTTQLMWPHGVSIGILGGTPLVTLPAKLLAELRGTPANLLGAWLAACWLLQPFAAVYALRGFGCRSPAAAGTAAIFSTVNPALLARLGHVPLCGHFLLLIALGQSARLLTSSTPTAWRNWIPPFCLLTAAILAHPYLFVYAAAVLAAPVVQAVLHRGPRAWVTIAGFLAAAVTPFAIFRLLSGGVGQSGGDYGFYSMNLLSPFWPQLSGLFGADLPVIDATGGQYEGFNYLGAGALLLLLLAIGAVARTGRLAWRPWLGLILVLVGLTAHAVTQRVFIGHLEVLYLGWRPWNLVFGVVQSSGRAFWVVGYAIVLGSLAILARRMSPAWFALALVAAVVLQLIDTTPMRGGAQATFAGAYPPSPTVALPPGATLLTTWPACLAAGPAQDLADMLQLEAVRGGMRLTAVRLARNPPAPECERLLADGLDLLLRPGEVRAFLYLPAGLVFRQAALGPGATCRAAAGAIICASLPSLPPGTAPPPGPALPTVSVPTLDISGPALDPLLSFGWAHDRDGLAWSDGNWATLLFRVAAPVAGDAVTVDLQLRALAANQGAELPVMMRVLGGAPLTAVLSDQRTTQVTVRVPLADTSDSIVRIALNIPNPTDPSRRGLAAPVRQAGVVLQSVAVRVAGPSHAVPPE